MLPRTEKLPLIAQAKGTALGLILPKNETPIGKGNPRKNPNTKIVKPKMRYLASLFEIISGSKNLSKRNKLRIIINEVSEIKVNIIGADCFNLVEIKLPIPVENNKRLITKVIA